MSSTSWGWYKKDERKGVAALLTRGAFDALMEKGLRAARESEDEWVSVLHVGIDALGAINQRHGYPVGDAVLEATARRLRERSEVFVAMCKVAGDEYALCLGVPPDTGRQVAARLVAEFGLGINVGGKRTPVGLSIGIASSLRRHASAGLVRCAAIAMRTVKSRGGAAFATYDPDAEERQRNELAIAKELRSAAARNQFELVYQPKVDAVALQVTAVEALLRWEHPVLGKVSPDIFIPIAERYGMMESIGDWVIQRALGQAARWRESGLNMRVAINVSGAQLQRADFAARLERRLELHNLPPSRFTCEITESVAVAAFPAARHALARLKEIGVHLSIDDFGTGYSCLSFLCQLPSDELKLDRSIVAEIGHSAPARIVVKSVVDMAHALGKRVVAEGVETSLQRDILLESGCDELQGFYFAKPMVAVAIGIWASDHRATAGQAFRPSLFLEEQKVLAHGGRQKDVEVRT